MPARRTSGKFDMRHLYNNGSACFGAEIPAALPQKNVSDEIDTTANVRRQFGGCPLTGEVADRKRNFSFLNRITKFQKAKTLRGGRTK
jgi:hypothetical protein